MDYDTGKLRRSVVLMALPIVLLIAGGPAMAQQDASGKPAAVAASAQPEARAILMRMAAFLGGTPRFSVNVISAYDSVQASGEKIEFGETRKVTVSRPDRLRVDGERSDGARVLALFDGKSITVVDGAAKVYATAPQPGALDESIVHFVRDLGVRLPLAMLLLSRLPAELEQRVQSVGYVEKTGILGSPAHHLAGRTDSVDFQVWIADGGKPLPVRIVLTYRAAAGQPQFRAQFSDWNLAPEIADATFVAELPEGAQKVAFASQLPRATPAGRKTATKGAK